MVSGVSTGDFIALIPVVVLPLEGGTLYPGFAPFSLIFEGPATGVAKPLGAVAVSTLLFLDSAKMVETLVGAF